MSVPPTAELESLLADDRWIRRLAHRLTADPGTAEDLAQDTWLAVLSGRAGHAGKERPWLGRVLRNTWKDLLRGRVRRERREQSAAREEATQSSDELVLELELRERLARALRELEEPYRRALVLRFLRDESLAAIAEQEHVAVSTIHERIERGLARLRARLDDEHGGRRAAWAATLITLAPKASAGAGTFEVMAVASALKIAAVVLVFGAGAAWWWSSRGREIVPVAEAVAAQPAGEAEREELHALAPAPVAREALAPTAPSVPAPIVAGDDAAVISGRVLDTRGRGVRGALLGWRKARDRDESAVSAADGAFELALAGRTLEENGNVVCRSPELVTLVFGQPFGNWTLVVAPRAVFAGTVVDETGAPVAGAELEFRLKDTLFRAVGMHAMGLEDEAWKTTSDALGRFELHDVTGGENVALKARARGFVDAEASLPEGGDLALLITLQRKQAIVELGGIVLGPSGDPVPGASVSAGKEIVTTGPDGRFTLLWDGGNGHVVRDEAGTWREEGAEHASVIALMEGYRPAQETLRERDLTAPFVLQLGTTLSITGLALDPEGQPLSGVVVWLQDPTRFGRERLTTLPGLEMDRDRTVEDLVCARAEPAAHTGADGRFELGCLMDRSYSVLALDPRTCSRSGPWSIAAGTQDVELVFTPEPTERVAGRIVSARGKPRGGLEVTPRRTRSWAAGAEAPELHGVETDAEGRFEFAQLATTGTALQIAAQPFSMRVLELDGFTDLAHLEIVEPELCELQVELAGDPLSADTLEVLDGSGAALELHEVYGGENSFAYSLETEVQLVDGRSRLLFVQETASTLVLSKAGQEILRVPIQLQPGQRVVQRL